jgi:sterol desaturase/sphingolipid hydroxylase (fatty acid hydroxylase superfamily)
VQQSSTALTKQTILASLPWSAGLAGILFVTGFIPCCGFIVFPAGVVGMAYVLVPKFGLAPTPETKNSLALNIGLGLGITSTVALALATLCSQLIGFLFIGATSAFSRDISGLAVGLTFGLFSLIAYLAVAIVGGIVVGTLCGFLGSLIAFDRTPQRHYY